jgi:hypothetical protein
MKLLIISIIVAGVLGVLALPKIAECTWCPSYTCYGSCGGDCVCITQGGDIGGSCYSVDQLNYWGIK